MSIYVAGNNACGLSSVSSIGVHYLFVLVGQVFMISHAWHEVWHNVTLCDTAALGRPAIQHLQTFIIMGYLGLQLFIKMISVNCYFFPYFPFWAVRNFSCVGLVCKSGQTGINDTELETNSMSAFDSAPSRLLATSWPNFGSFGFFNFHTHVQRWCTYNTHQTV